MHKRRHSEKLETLDPKSMRTALGCSSCRIRALNRRLAVDKANPRTGQVQEYGWWRLERKPTIYGKSNPGNKRCFGRAEVKNSTSDFI